MTKQVKLAFIKPNAAVLGSPRIFKPYGQCGAEYSDYIPDTASCADDICLIRSMRTEETNHIQAFHYAITGHRPNPAMSFPSLGSIISKEMGPRNNLPMQITEPEFGGDGLFIRRLIRAGVDLCEQVTPVHALTLGECDLLQFAVDTGGHGHRIERLNGAQPRKIDRYVRMRHNRRVDGDRRRRIARGGIGLLVYRRAPREQQQCGQAGCPHPCVFTDSGEVFHLSITLDAIRRRAR